MTGELCTKSIAGFFIRCFSCSSASLRNSVLGLLLVATSGFAIAADQKSNLNSCKLTEREEAGLNGNLSIDVHAVDEYTAAIAHMLKAEEFEELDCVADHARSSKERFSGGTWKIHVLYGGVSEAIQYPVKHATQEDWNNLLQRLQQWKTARPQSITAPVALARAYINYAYDARGEGFASTVSDSGWKLFRERIAEAKRILDQSTARPGRRCPEWYVDMLLVAKDQSWEKADTRALFDEANKFEPGYYYYARVVANYLLPKWSGEEGDTEKFLQEIAESVGESEGDILYFQVASADYVICACEDSPHLSWERIEHGFEASESKFGVSVLNLNRIAFLAAHFGKTDPIVADKALTRIGEQWDEETWHEKQDFEMVKGWAAHTAPFVVALRKTEAAAAANLKTPEGPRYQQTFEKAYKGLVQECVRTDGSSVDRWEGKFEALTSVGAKGTVEDNKIYSGGPVVMCLYHKLLTLQQEKAMPFPPPPQDSYWVRLDLDWADFAPVAAK